jgi:hypothetical protein
MILVPENPASNILGTDVNDQNIADAVAASGYPLQLVAARTLRPAFSLQEEWSYIDPETSSTRTIDLVASTLLFEWWQDSELRIRPALNFVIECKQSALPYIFFLTESRPWLPDFPIISGLKSNNIVVTSDDDPSTWNYRPLDVLGLDKHPFLTETVPFCTTFSKCVRKGKELTLSGSEPYQSLMFPIIKAACHFNDVQRPPSRAYWFDCGLIVGLAVLDAPMVGVHVTDSGNEMKLLPRVRVVRHQPLDHEHKVEKPRWCNWTEKGQTFGIDVVHKDYLETYVRQHALPFAEEFAKRALKHAEVLADSRGFVPGMGANAWREIESCLQPSNFRATRKRIRAILRGMADSFRHRPGAAGPGDGSDC